MTVTDQLKIIDKIKATHDLDRLAAKISAYSSGDLRKYEYLNGEDLGYKPSVIQQAKFEYSPLGMLYSKALKNDEVKSVARSKSDFNYDSNHAFQTFYKEYDECEKMSLDSKYSKMKKFNELLINSKSVKTKKNRNETQKGANYEKCRRVLRKVL